ncbi:MAG TPA: TauD/TfdA family dioxygenase [Stellaceae bacterium]|nr:TauD/TfdA family dioxygenase [Stellaceae bacterium]
MAVEIRPLQGEFAGEVAGAAPDLRVDEATLALLEAAWFRHSILIFRGLDMTPADQVAFTRRLGPLHIMVPGEFNMPGLPEVWVVGNAKENGRPIALRGAGMGFHTDGEDKRMPNAGSFLYARIVPPEGGDTLFADMYAVYAALPSDVKRTIAGRRARFSRAEMHAINYPDMRPYTQAELAARPDVYHPLARRHDRSGRVSLYVGRWACDIEGLPKDEGRAIIAFLQEFARQERFVYRHRWRDGDAVLWDNRCTQHCATPFDEARYTRLMHRTTLEGTAPIMAEAQA